jgi:SulP family sulfate permease
VLAVVVLGGVQVSLGLAGVARLMRCIPRSGMVGFVNAWPPRGSRSSSR